MVSTGNHRPSYQHGGEVEHSDKGPVRFRLRC